MKRKHHYTDFEQYRLHRIPGSRNYFGWFRCTFTQKTLILAVWIDDYWQAKRVWEDIISDIALDGEGQFDGLHVAIGDGEMKEVYKGSIIFLSKKSHSLLSHEILHAVTKCFNYIGIDDEEARCLALSSWMEISQTILKLKDNS